MKNIKVAVLVDKDLPSDHSFIQGVLERALPRKNCDVTFFGFGSGEKPTEHQSLRFVLMQSKYNNFFVKKLEKIFGFTSNIKEHGPFDVLFTRNDPVFLIIGWWLKITGAVTKHFHQISHLQAFSKTEKRAFLFRIKAFGDLLLRKVFLNYADRILLISESMREFLLREWPQFTHKYLVYPLGIDVSDFNQVKPYQSREIDVVYIGTLAKSRRIDVIIDAIGIYNQKYGNLVLNIWGASHNKQDDLDMINHARKLNLDSKVIFHGKKGRQEVLQKLKNTKIGLSTIPSGGILNQISPTKLMEYFAAGCCVIATGGIPDQEQIVRESGSGLLINFNPEEIADAMHQILKDEEQAAALAEKGREYIFQHRSYNQMSERLRNDMLQTLAEK